MSLQLLGRLLERHKRIVGRPCSLPNLLTLLPPLSLRPAFIMLIHAIRSASLVALLAASSVFTSPLRSRTPYAVKESHNVPKKWNDIGPAPPNTVINLHIGLKQSQFDELERHLYEGMPFLQIKVNYYIRAFWLTRAS